jgi:hypothetical protein
MASTISITSYGVPANGANQGISISRRNMIASNTFEVTNCKAIEERLHELREALAGRSAKFVIRLVEGRKPRGFDTFVRSTPLTLLIAPARSVEA